MIKYMMPKDWAGTWGTMAVKVNIVLSTELSDLIRGSDWEIRDLTRFLALIRSYAEFSLKYDLLKFANTRHFHALHL